MVAPLHTSLDRWGRRKVGEKDPLECTGAVPAPLTGGSLFEKGVYEHQNTNTPPQGGDGSPESICLI